MPLDPADAQAQSGKLVVALDGPSGVGKSTIAQQLATRLGLPYLDTGAMYRAFGLKVLDKGLDPDDQTAVEALAEVVQIEVRPVASISFEVLVDGHPVSDSIRTPVVSQATSKVAAYPIVRAIMVSRQRQAAQRIGAVVEGRDIGTAVFPETKHKFFLEAPVAVRAERRYAQLQEKGERAFTLQEVEEQVRERDLRDSNRVASPLKRDPSYRVVNTAEATVDEIVDQIAELVRHRGAD